ncbi:ApeP family dehydratase [Acerihabitans arboris]|uniref:3-hydroxy-fatty acyl-ACP dehydratase n=1 Tax=Acerihabitans arboris TaxID=2691583 RepID=A0A845SL18_9GAMM|nr:3-hydroxy-fatty acyl-ACP dehydratase [Acerihabitans arboris]
MPDALPAAQYLPHDTPMVLVERLCGINADSARCQVTVGSQGVLRPFLDADGNLPAWYALEMMAQTIGVWSGWHGRQRGETPRAGLLLGARALNCAQPVFTSGSELDISIILLLQDERIGSFECLIQRAGETLASGRLNTYQPDDNEINQLLAQE